MGESNANVGKQLTIVDEPATGLMGMLERVALNPDLPVEKLERLLDMQLKVRALEAKEAFAQALSTMQPKLPILKERGEVQGRYRYALWEDIVGVITPILTEHGFAINFRTSSTKDSVTVVGILRHVAGHEAETELTLPLDSSGNKPAIQALGSSTSYGKRYAASALLNLRTGEIDDDGAVGANGPPMVNSEQVAELQRLMDEIGIIGERKERMFKAFRISKLEDIKAQDFDACRKIIESKRKS